jgi:hypothetical protein
MKKVREESVGGLVYFVGACLAVFGSICFAGEIVLVNGDRLTGQVEKIVEGKVYFNSTIAGAVVIYFAQVRTFSTEVKYILGVGWGF